MVGGSSVTQALPEMGLASFMLRFPTEEAMKKDLNFFKQTTWSTPKI